MIHFHFLDAKKKSATHVHLHGFSEQEHPRGQPKNAGQFVKGSGGKKAPASAASSPKAKTEYAKTYSHNLTYEQQIRHDQSIAEASANWAKKGAPITNDIRRALKDYRNVGYQKINNCLGAAGMGPKSEKCDPESAEKAKAIQDWLDRSSAPADVSVFRGMDREHFERLYGTLKPGQTLTTKGFMSTTLDDHVAAVYAGSTSLTKEYIEASPHRESLIPDGVMVEIRVPKGAKAAPVASAGRQNKEGEVLLQHGSKLKVVGVKKASGDINSFTTYVLEMAK